MQPTFGKSTVNLRPRDDQAESMTEEEKDRARAERRNPPRPPPSPRLVREAAAAAGGGTPAPVPEPAAPPAAASSSAASSSAAPTYVEPQPKSRPRVVVSHDVIDINGIPYDVIKYDDGSQEVSSW